MIIIIMNIIILEETRLELNSLTGKTSKYFKGKGLTI